MKWYSRNLEETMIKKESQNLVLKHFFQSKEPGFLGKWMIVGLRENHKRGVWRIFLCQKKVLENKNVTLMGLS